MFMWHHLVMISVNHIGHGRNNLIKPSKRWKWSVLRILFEGNNTMDLCANLQKTGFWGKQGAGCIFLAESTGRVLVAKRSMHVLEPWTWSTIGGAMDPEDNFPETTVL